MTESGSASAGVAARAAIDETDLAIIEALQTSPRASWSRIAGAADVSPSTAQRRWERLTSQGLAWLTAYPAFSEEQIGYLEIDCEPGRIDAVAADLATWPWAFTVEHMAGEYDLLVSVVAADLAALSLLVRRDIAALAGIGRVRTRIGGRWYTEGSDWRLRALDRTQRAALAPERGAPALQRGVRGPAAAAIAADMRPLVDELGRDARLPWTELGLRTGLGEHAARRRSLRLIRENVLFVRCDFAHAHAGWPVSQTMTLDVPPHQLDAVGTRVARLPEVRMAGAVTGTGNLLVTLWARGFDDCHAVESAVTAEHPVRVQGRSISVHTYKRMGRLLDGTGKAAGGHVVVMAYRPDGW
ncbi:Lrp/AsnC family transcriptional regulator [Streptomyces sp. LE64]|uniref:Lrp/AsnC family transcriptional regulator n=1 Tax=Streptomyces sp. LE64 TaxID=3448653 RepID=UPI004041621E